MALFSIGALKVALKATIKRYGQHKLAEVSGEVIGDEVVRAFSRAINNPMSDQVAIVLNRIKSVPNNKLTNFVSKELGIPVNEVKGIIKEFRQSPAMKEAAVGTKFKQEANKAFGELLGGEGRTVKKIIENIDKYTNDIPDNTPTSTPVNNRVYNKLREIEGNLKVKFDGVGSNNRPVTFNVSMTHLYNASVDYTADVERELDIISNDIIRYAEFFESEGEDDILIVDDTRFGYIRYHKKDVREYIKDIRADVSRALRRAEQ